MITTVSADQGQILRDIAILHNQGHPFHADLTYSTGHFWAGCELPPPAIRMDLLPAPPGAGFAGNTQAQNIQADLRRLPFLPGSITSVVVDPPFIHAPGKASIMGNRFSGFPSQKALREMYEAAAVELCTAIAPHGLVVWKVQDIVESGKQVWNHIFVHDIFAARGWTMVDLFILTSKNRIQGHNHARQFHARKAHSYFLVFRRR